jgi:hypothetical protein
MASLREGQPRDVGESSKAGLNSVDAGIRLGCAVERFQALGKNPDVLRLVLDKTGHNPNQAPFVIRMMNLVNTGVPTDVGVAGRRFEDHPPIEEPGSEKKRIAEGIYTEVDSSVVGAARLRVHTPRDLRIIDGGYVHWNLVSRAEGADLRRLAEKSGDFLTLVIVDPELLEERRFRELVMATHPGDSKLTPKGWLSGVAKLAGKTVFERVQGSGLIGVSFQSKESTQNEFWVTDMPSQGEEQAYRLLGKQVNSGG